jgi:putative ABC transport system permease protein
MSNFPVDHDFFETYKIKLIAGRGFNESDHHFEFEKLDKIVLNRKAVELLGFTNPEDVLGRQLNFSQRDLTVIGVIENFHQESFRSPMEPTFFFPAYDNYGQTSIRLKAENREETIVAVENAYTKFYPDNLFEYYFIEDSYMRQYQDDNRFSKVIGIFTFLAIVISCLGLIGLSSYTASLRTKEIGIRKVLGASVRHVVLLLSGNFIRLVLISIVLSIPIAYMAMQYWLSAYAYRITPTPAMFLLPVLLVFIIAALTVSVQVMKAALADPAKTLKCE